MSEVHQDAERRRDWPGLAGAAFFIAVGVYVVAASFQMTPMAAVFPRTVGAILIVLSIIQVIMSLAGRSGRSLEQGESVTEQAEGLGRRLTLIATMLAWALLFPVIGFFVTSLAAAIMLLATGQFGPLGRGRLIAYVAALVVMVGCFYALMGNVLHIPMPHGLLF